MNIALVHYWLVRMRGGEVVLRELMNAHPEADVFTNVFDKDGMSELFSSRPDPTTTYVGRLPFAQRLYPALMPLMPAALEKLDMSRYDLIVSSESGPSKWVIPAPYAAHICYIHSPMRYLWDQRHLYRQRLPGIARPLFDHVTRALRADDIISSYRVDRFVANSSFVAERVRRYYRRESEVVHPPVKTEDFFEHKEPEDFYLFLGQLVSYKNVRHAVDACVKLGRKLVVVGDGSDRKYVEAFSRHGIEYRGRVPRSEVVDLLSRCRALLFPGVEDFGIVPVEALAAGRPVIAFGAGGVLETIEHAKTGILYGECSSDGLIQGIRDFEEWERSFSPSVARARASDFSVAKFHERWAAVVSRLTS